MKSGISLIAELIIVPRIGLLLGPLKGMSRNDKRRDMIDTDKKL